MLARSTINGQLTEAGMKEDQSHRSSALLNESEPVIAWLNGASSASRSLKLLLSAMLRGRKYIITIPVYGFNMLTFYVNVCWSIKVHVIKVASFTLLGS
jgi:hypothetical protein